MTFREFNTFMLLSHVLSICKFSWLSQGSFFASLWIKNHPPDFFFLAFMPLAFSKSPCDLHSVTLFDLFPHDQIQVQCFQQEPGCSVFFRWVFSTTSDIKLGKDFFCQFFFPLSCISLLIFTSSLLHFLQMNGQFPAIFPSTPRLPMASHGSADVRSSLSIWPSKANCLPLGGMKTKLILGLGFVLHVCSTENPSKGSSQSSEEGPWQRGCQGDGRKKVTATWALKVS